MSKIRLGDISGRVGEEIGDHPPTEESGTAGHENFHLDAGLYQAGGPGLGCRPTIPISGHRLAARSARRSGPQLRTRTVRSPPHPRPLDRSIVPLPPGERLGTDLAL